MSRVGVARGAVTGDGQVAKKRHTSESEVRGYFLCGATGPLGLACQAVIISATGWEAAGTTAPRNIEVVATSPTRQPPH
jgi:hypothetical protein